MSSSSNYASNGGNPDQPHGPIGDPASNVNGTANATTNGNAPPNSAASVQLAVVRAPSPSASALIRNQPPIDFQHSPFTNNASQPPEPSLLEYWRIIRRRKGTLIVAATLGIIAGALFTLPQTPIYQAKTSIEIQDLNQDFLGMKQVQQVADVPTGNMVDIQTQIRVLQSDTLKDRTGSALNQSLLATGANSPSATTKEDRTSAWRRALGLDRLTVFDSADSQDSTAAATAPGLPSSATRAIAYAKRNLKARAAGQTRIIEILVDSPDPKIAAGFANTLTAEFIEQHLEARWNSTQRTSTWLSKQLEELKIKLEQSEDQLQAYARDSGLLFTGTNSENESQRASVSEEKLKQLQQNLSAASSDRIAKQSRFELAKSAPEESLPDVLNDSSLRDYQSKLTEIRRQVSDLSTIYNSEYKTVRRLKAQEAILESALAAERNAILQRIANDFQEAKRREAMLEKAYKVQTGVVTRQNEKSIQYNILKREVDTSRQIYEALLQRVKESSIAAAMRASNVRIVDPAAVPRFAYKPSIPINCGVGLLAGAFLGLSLIVMKERANVTFREPGEVKDLLGLPELGVIPNATATRARRYLSGSNRAFSSLTADDKSVELVTWQDKPGIQAEAFRATLMSILFANHAGRMPRTLAITSPGPAEGKTTATCNLAIAIAELNSRVLLIDGDLRKPRVHHIFGLDGKSPGFAALLKQPNLSAAEARSYVRPSNVSPALNILPAGPGAISATTFLYTPQLQKLIDIYLEEYDVVIFDTPPMLQIPDARVIGRHVEGTVLVVRSNKTTKEATRAAQYRLTEDRVSIFGVLINDWNPKFSTGGYYGYYYKSYYDSYHGKDSGKEVLAAAAAAAGSGSGDGD